MRKPKLVISRCLNSENCRYDGQGYNDKVIASIKDYIDIETVCPEKGIGLSTPREPIRIEKDKDTYKLVQLKSNIDYTSQMTEFADDFLKGLDDIDGFILKTRSPTCGIKDVKIYPKGQKCTVRKNGTGFFAAKVLDKYPDMPIIDDGRLKNFTLRDDFFTKIYLINSLKSEETIKTFHNKNSLLLKSYDSHGMAILISISHKDTPSKEDIEVYKKTVYEILKHKRTKKSKADTSKHVFNKYRSRLNEDEIAYFEKLLDDYDNNKIPFGTIISVLYTYVVRFHDEELINQTFFNPYPKELLDTSDTGKRKDLYSS